MSELNSGKRPWQSRTNWIALISAIAAFIPQVQVFIQENPESYAVIMSGVFMLLRQISKEKINIG